MNVTLPVLAVNVPPFVHVPEMLILALGALNVAPELIVRFENWVPAIVDPVIRVVPDRENVTVAFVVNDPPFTVKLAPAMATVKELALSVPLLTFRSPLIVMFLSRVTLPAATVKLFKTDELEGSSRLVVRFPL